MAAHTYTPGERITYRFCGGVPSGSVICIELPGMVHSVVQGRKPRVSVLLDNGLFFDTPASDGSLAPDRRRAAEVA